MAEKEYIERGALIAEMDSDAPENWTNSDTEIQEEWDYHRYRDIIFAQPAADVAPRSEIETATTKWAELYAESQSKWEKAYTDLEYTLIGVMHSVDKWLEGDELKKDEVNRAATMREKTLRIVENAKSEVAREIFEEIEALATKHLALLEIINPQVSAVAAGGKHAFDLVLALTTELKKKYTEENHGT